MTASRWRSRWRRLAWGAPAALFLLAPKCVLCVAGYLGLAAALGLSFGPSLCGGPAPRSAGPMLLLGLGGAAVTVVAATVLLHRRRRRAPGGHWQRT